MIVSYTAQIIAQGIAQGHAEELHWFGFLNQVNDDLKAKEKEFTQAIIMQVADPKELALNRVRLQVVKHLQTHDMNIVPIFPAIGQGQFQMRDQNAAIMFTVLFKVSRRPAEQEASLIKPDTNPPVKLIIPG